MVDSYSIAPFVQTTVLSIELQTAFHEYYSSLGAFSVIVLTSGEEFTIEIKLDYNSTKFAI